MRKVFSALPESYRRECKKQGSIESHYYMINESINSEYKKHLNVYLPYGYNDEDQNKCYNILYLMHGGGEDENFLFGGPGDNRELKNILDHMIENKDIQPLIVVTPTFYGVKNGRINDKVLSHVETLDHPLPLVETEFFYEELVEDIIPFVENKYRSHLNLTNEEGMKASRSHRAFGGFSMGSVTTWNVFINCLPYFKYFIPLSGECWQFGMKSEGKMAQETAEYLMSRPKAFGLGYEDYYLLCASGVKDIAYPNMKPQMEALMALEDRNIYFMECDEGIHWWHWVYQYLYGILPDLFIEDYRGC